MDSKRKKIVSPLMSVLMVSGMIQIPAYAEEEAVYEKETAAEKTVIG